jgi:putative ABC transport system permease protein
MYVNFQLKVKINRDLMVSIVRMTVQLLLVGLFLTFIFDLENLLINVIYFLLMIFFGTLSVVSRTEYKFKELRGIIYATFILVTLPMVYIFNSLVLGVDNFFEASYMIPVTGMLLGNVLGGLVISVNYYLSSLMNRYHEYKYYLSIYATKKKALLPFVRETVKMSINPTIASLETMGLITLPGMMTGLILGGNSPVGAVKYQIGIMLSILIVRYFSTLIVVILVSMTKFDSMGRFELKKESM